jgi:rRNA maturation endonuclease Nob1
VPALVADAFIPAGTTAFLAGNGRVVNPPRPPKFCTNCGRAIEGDGAFCPECGAGIKRG